ncbi:hypothetical protein ID866_9580 [Astraeus odoratus]
MFAQS